MNQFSNAVLERNSTNRYLENIEIPSEGFNGIVLSKEY